MEIINSRVTPITAQKDTSVFAQAYKDTEKCLGYLWYYGLVILVMGSAGVVTWYFTPSTASTLQQALISAATGIVSGLGMLLITYTIALLIAPYRQRNDIRRQRDEANKQIVQLDAELKQIRKEIQEQSGYKLIAIPEILSDIAKVVIQIVEEKKKLKPTAQDMLEVISELLDIGTNDYPLSLKRLPSKAQITHLVKTFRVRMGLKKRDARKANIWIKRIINAMDKHGMGLNLSNCDEYNNLRDKLDKHRVHISGLTLDASIERYILHLQGLWDIKLLADYSDTYKLYSIFPDNIKDFLDEMETQIYGQMRRELIAVNQPLERWLGGATE